MIENDKQLNVTRMWINNFKDNLDNLDKKKINSELMYQAYYDMYLNQIKELEEEVNEYLGKKNNG